MLLFSALYCSKLNIHGLLVRQNKQFEDVTLASGSLRWEYFTSFMD